MCARWVLVSNGDMGVCWIGVGEEWRWSVRSVNVIRQSRHVRVLDNNGSSQGYPIAWLVTSQIMRNDIRHEEAILVVSCLPFLRARNDFHIISETAGQEH